MKDQKNKIINILSIGFLSFFGTGFAPKAPGTFGSAATIPLILLLSYMQLSFVYVLILTVLIFILACIIAHKVQIETDTFDPGWIVIDEVVGMLITWLFVFPNNNWQTLLVVFATFRVFDIIKIWPASYIDKNIKNGFSTIFDDVISALYAGFVVWLLNYFHWIS